eukprot:TRINITY_DN8082_c0_g1_i1.p1 TRINITY_DN8082_c0_g1~~TRINITY_DN8082_c0_g1_i1.p1  ORF type:complete len:522 (-),score=112.22 TRINITY_DN8082_c0_g1_i1:40-1566(-)
MKTIGSIFKRNADYYPHREAVVFEGTRMTHLQFNQSINKLCYVLSSLGVKKDEKVSLLLPNCLELLESYWALAKLGAVAVPLSTLLNISGLEILLSQSDSGYLITNEQFKPMVSDLATRRPNFTILYISDDLMDEPNYHKLKLPALDIEPVVDINPNDDYNIVYSSGTTGLPKGIVLTHEVRIYYALIFATLFRMTPESVVLHAGAIIFNGCFVDLMPAVYLGSKYILHPSFNVEKFIETVESEKVTHLMLVPSQIVALLNSPNFTLEKLHSLEMICTVGAPLHAEHKESLDLILPGRFYELYGLTEGFITVLDKTTYRTKPDSVGVPIPFSQMKIIDTHGNSLPPHEIGEICGKSPLLMKHYYKDPHRTSLALQNGWLHSGDLGYYDDDGFLYLVDRKKDMIISGGVNIYPRDIEEIIAHNEKVREVSVFGTHDSVWGETPVAAIILKSDTTAEPQELKEWINSQVHAKFQRVREVIILDDFPRSVSGKILKRELKAMYEMNDKPKL